MSVFYGTPDRLRAARDALILPAPVAQPLAEPAPGAQPLAMPAPEAQPFPAAQAPAVLAPGAQPKDPFYKVAFVAAEDDPSKTCTKAHPSGSDPAYTELLDLFNEMKAI